MHATYIRPGGVQEDIPLGMLDEINKFIYKLNLRLDDISSLLDNNRVWQYRLKNVGIITAKEAYLLGFSGVMLRGSGISWDLRKELNYEIYKNLKFKIPIGSYGDSYDRYLIRIEEMRQSIQIIKQCINNIPLGEINYEDKKKIGPSRNEMRTKMEGIIHHFKFYSGGYKIENGKIYIVTETPKGELGIYLNIKNNINPYRCKIKSPGFLHLQGLENMVRGNYLADVVTVLGTQDVVFGEIDR
jgi:NADH dehydrogenase (ubiquinone) Fe-S protein 2